MNDVLNKKIFAEFVYCLQSMCGISSEYPPMEAIQDFGRLYREHIERHITTQTSAINQAIFSKIEDLISEMNGLAHHEDSFRLFDDEAFNRRPEWEATKLKSKALFEMLWKLEYESETGEGARK